MIVNIFFRLGKDKNYNCAKCKTLQVSLDEINHKLQNCETKKIELRLENKKLKQIVELNLQEVYCSDLLILLYSKNLSLDKQITIYNISLKNLF